MEASENTNQKTFDWDIARERVSAVLDIFAEDGDASDVVLERIWAKRAEQLAKEPLQEDSGEQLQLVFFRLRNEIYGLDALHIRTIRREQQTTSVPRSPAWVCGVVNIRGEILSVIDLYRFFNLSETEDLSTQENDISYLIVVETPEMELALRVDDVLGVEEVSHDNIQQTQNTTQEILPEYVQGIVQYIEEKALDVEKTPKLVIILNPQAIFSDERLTIYDEIA